MKKQAFNMFFLLVFFSFYACDDSETIVPEKKSSLLTGEYNMSLLPHIAPVDTVVLKGFKSNDFQSSMIVSDKFYLYEDDNSNLVGYFEAFDFRGSRKGDSVILDVFSTGNGDFSGPKDLKNGTIRMKINEFGSLEGLSEITTDPDSLNLDNQIDKIILRKINDITLPMEMALKDKSASLQSTLCNITSGILSFGVGILTDNAFRPMGSCWLNKDGGGYYLFGRRGPGSLLPLWTQTVYFPYELSACSSRKYGFTISMGNQNTDLNSTLDLLKKVFKYSGFASEQKFLDDFKDFYNKFGNFALCAGYSMNSKNYSLYVLTSNNNVNAIMDHPLVKGIESVLKKVPYHSFDTFHGTTIKDDFHLVRSGVPDLSFHCSTPIVFYYLVGTADVTFD